MERKLRINEYKEPNFNDPQAIIVSGYKRPNYLGPVADRYFRLMDDASEIKSYAYSLLDNHLYVTIYNFYTGEHLDITPLEYNDFDNDSIDSDIDDFLKNRY